MAEEMFLKIDGIQGESTDASHKDEINILSYTWGESLPAATARQEHLPPHLHRRQVPLHTRPPAPHSSRRRVAHPVRLCLLRRPGPPSFRSAAAFRSQPKTAAP